MPPVGAFWSLTMYDAEGFQVANSLNRFAIGDRDALKFNNDGSLDLYIQNESPGADKETNWLPAPKNGQLALTLRLYAPKPQVADGRWNPPAIRRINSECDAERCPLTGLSACGTFRPISNVRHSVVVRGKPDIATEPKWSA